jgi:hypothetical protein
MWIAEEAWSEAMKTLVVMLGTALMLLAGFSAVLTARYVSTQSHPDDFR